MKKLLLICYSLLVVAAGVFAQSANPAPYCNASFDDMQGFPVDDHIDRVSFGTLNNASNAQYAAPHYVFYNNLTTASFMAGNTYTLKVKFTLAGSTGYGVWIDYNHDNAFDTLTERVSFSTSYMSADSITTSVTIPANAQNGNTRMRVRVVEDDTYHANHGYREQACTEGTTVTDTMDWGETEDYTINIANPSGIDEATIQSSISLYPNPASDMITLQMADHTDTYTYTVINMLGQVMDKGTIMGTRQSVNISSLAEGIYLVKISSPIARVGRVLKFEKSE